MLWAAKRDDVILATKFGHSASKPDGGRGGAPEWVRSSLEAACSDWAPTA